MIREDLSTAVQETVAESSSGSDDLLLEVSGQGADIGPIEQADPDDKPTTDLSHYPRLKSLETELSQDHSADEFEEALETLLDRIDLLEHHRTRTKSR